MERLRVGSGWHSSKRLRYTTPTTPLKKKGKRRSFHPPSCSRPGLVGFFGRFRSRCPCAPNPRSAAEACWSGRSRSGWTDWGAFCAHSVQNSCIHIHQAEAAGAVRPGAGGPVVAPCTPPRSRRSPDLRRVRLTRLRLAARVGNLQPEGEPGKCCLCGAASLPLAATKRRDQVLLSSVAGPVPGAGRCWRGLAPPSSRHGLTDWARRNAPPGGSEFPFRWGKRRSKACAARWGAGGGVALASVSSRSGARLASPLPPQSPGLEGAKWSAAGNWR